MQDVIHSKIKRRADVDNEHSGMGAPMTKPTDRSTGPGTDQVHPAAPGEEGLWDANDVAGFLKTSRSWVYQRAQAGQLPCLKIGGLLRFEPDAIRAFIRGQGASGRRVVPISSGNK